MAIGPTNTNRRAHSVENPLMVTTSVAYLGISRPGYAPVFVLRCFGKSGATAYRPCSQRQRHFQRVQLAGVVESFAFVQSGPKPVLASGTLSMANGPALCSPLNGVGLVGSK